MAKETWVYPVLSLALEEGLYVLDNATHRRHVTPEARLAPPGTASDCSYVRILASARPK